MSCAPVQGKLSLLPLRWLSVRCAGTWPNLFTGALHLVIHDHQDFVARSLFAARKWLHGASVTVVHLSITVVSISTDCFRSLLQKTQSQEAEGERGGRQSQACRLSHFYGPCPRSLTKCSEQCHRTGLCRAWPPRTKQCQYTANAVLHFGVWLALARSCLRGHAPCGSSWPIGYSMSSQRNGAGAQAALSS